MGVDPGYERVGIAIVEKENGKEHVVFSECFKTSAKLPFPERLAEISSEIEKVIGEYKPEALSIETLIFNTNQKTAIMVAQARGAIMAASVGEGLIVHEYSPLQIKVAITGYGRADKKQMINMVGKLVSMPSSKRQDDEYDAIAAALTCIASVKIVGN